MIKFEEGNNYIFKAIDSTTVVGECIERCYLLNIECIIFKIPEKGIKIRCRVEYELGDYTLGDYDDAETLQCVMDDRVYVSDSRWVSE